jgi:hypothetical protein
MLEPHDRGDEEWSIVVPREEGHLASGLGPGDRGQAQGPPVIVTDEFLFRESHVARWCATNSVANRRQQPRFREKDVARWHQQEEGRSQISHFPSVNFMALYGHLLTVVIYYEIGISGISPHQRDLSLRFYPSRYFQFVIIISWPTVCVLKSGFWQKFSSYGNTKVLTMILE